MSTKGKKGAKQNHGPNSVSSPADAAVPVHTPIAPEPKAVEAVASKAPVQQPLAGKQVPAAPQQQETVKPAPPKPSSTAAHENGNGHVAEKKASSGQRNVDIIWPWEGYNVLVAGSFNGWQGVPTESVGGVKKLTVALPPGKHEYKFIVDGEWKYDGTKPLSRDHRGNINNSIEV